MMDAGGSVQLPSGQGADVSLVKSSPSTASHSRRIQARVPWRLGVASRLLLAFLGISGVAVVGAGVAIFSFRDIGNAFDRITATGVPAVLTSLETSRQVERVVSAAPALLAAVTPAEHANIYRKIGSEMQELAALLKELGTRGVDAVALGSMQSAVSHLRINLKSIDKLVTDRMVVSELKRGRLSNALNVNSESQSLLTPWLQIVDGEIAQSRRVVNDARVGADEQTKAARRLVQSTESYHALQRIQFLITSVSERLQQISALDDVDTVRIQVFRIQQSLREALAMTAGLNIPDCSRS